VDRGPDELARPLSPRRVAVVGGGWAGLAAAVSLVRRGTSVTLLEMSPALGGRARGVAVEPGVTLDNGQHILVGAYVRTLALMREVGVDPEAALLRRPLTLQYPDGHGLVLPAGPAVPAFVRAVLACRGWRWTERIALLAAAVRWRLQGFRCPPGQSVAALCRGLPRAVREDLVEPLCVAALNTPAEAASAEVFLRVLRDALFAGPGAADLLLPRRSLDELLPRAASRWLEARGARVELGRRATSLATDGSRWRLDGETFDAVVLACSAAEAARLAEAVSPGWAEVAGALHYEPIVTVYLTAPGGRLGQPMVALRAGPGAPAQFAFDHGQLGGPGGRFAFVISGAADWVAAGREATVDAVLAQAREAFPPGTWPEPPTLLRLLAEKRATFRCTPALRRPPANIAPMLWACGDYVEGPYPATLEGAVRSGEAAAAGIAC
jgi:squalene-associated FAD-dependent desaturase